MVIGLVRFGLPVPEKNKRYRPVLIIKRYRLLTPDWRTIDNSRTSAIYGVPVRTDTCPILDGEFGQSL